MMSFIIRNKKVLSAVWLVTAVIFTVMLFVLISYTQGPAPTKEEKIYLFLGSTTGMPLLIFLIIYLKSGIYSYKLNKNIRYKPFADFFKQNWFEVGWIDENSYWTIAEKVMVGIFIQKTIICRIDEKHVDRIDFIILGLNIVIK